MDKLQRQLSARHISFLALGSALGTGLFYGSAAAIQLAGPAVLITYIVGGSAVYMVMRALGEMAVREPIAGSFSRYAGQYLGPFAGFLTGWTYILEMVIVCLADVTAFGIYMGFWWPDVPQWMWVLGIVVLLCGLNLCSVKWFGELEFWLSLVKILAIMAMIAGGVLIVLLGLKLHDMPAPGLRQLWTHGGFMPHGMGGVIVALSVVMFAYGGIEVIGVTGGEAKQPETVLPKAIRIVPARILLFYVLATGVLMTLFPWDRIGHQGSPFVQIFSGLGLKSAATALNFIVVLAAVSAINSDIFSAGRMMHGMASQGQAPCWFAATSPRGAPWVAVLILAAVLLLGVGLNYLLPQRVFLIIASIATFATVWVWLMILLSQQEMRRRLGPAAADELKFKMPLWPLSSQLAIAFMLFVIGVLGYSADTRVSLYVGAAWIVLLWIAWQARVKKCAARH